MYRILKRCLR